MGIMEAIGAVKSTWSAIETAIKIRDEVKLNELKIAFSQQIVTLYDMAAQHAQRNAEQAAENAMLQGQAADLTARLKRLQDYEACFLPSGARVYRPKLAAIDVSQHYHVCPLCYETESLAVTLQPAGVASLACPRCKTRYRTAGFNTGRPRFAIMD